MKTPNLSFARNQRAEELDISKIKSDLGLHQKMASEDIVSIPLERLFLFEGDSFHLNEEKVLDICETMTTDGQLVPALVRPYPGRPGDYQVIAGKHRREACKRCKIPVLECRIRDYDDATAVRVAANSNVQRDGWLPSERALVYKNRMATMNRQGQRTDLKTLNVELATSCQIDTKSEAGTNESAKALAKEYRTSASTIFRMIRLLRLPSSILDQVDAGTITLQVADHLTKLQPDELEILASFDTQIISSLSKEKALELMEASGDKKRLSEKLSIEEIQAIIHSGEIVEESANQNKPSRPTAPVYRQTSQMLMKDLKKLPENQAKLLEQQDPEVVTDYLLDKLYEYLERIQETEKNSVSSE